MADTNQEVKFTGTLLYETRQVRGNTLHSFKLKVAGTAQPLATVTFFGIVPPGCAITYGGAEWPLVAPKGERDAVQYPTALAHAMDFRELPG